MSRWFPSLVRKISIAADLGHSSFEEVDTWLIDLATDDTDLGLLDAPERQRARSFKFAADRRRFIAGRSAVRRILADYSGIEAQFIELTATPQGKPMFREGALLHGKAISFNLSHSEDLALLAVGKRQAVGIDVEIVRSIPERIRLAQRYFTSSEIAELDAARSDAEADALFIQCWTRKEAVLKALGTGLHTPPRDIEVGVGTAEREVRLHDGTGNSTVRVRSLVPALPLCAPATSAALAILLDSTAGSSP